MSRPLVSVVMSTYQRAHLLARSIHGYNRSDFPLDRLEVVVVDDGSTDTTHNVVYGFDPRIDLKVVRLRKTPGLWRDCAATINHGIRIASGEFVIITHPEIVPGRRSIRACLDGHAEVSRREPGVRAWVSAKGYYLKPADMTHLDLVKFDERGPLACRDIPGFRDAVPGGNPDYHPDAIDRPQVWQSWIFGGTDRSTWKEWGGMIETQRWGTVDIALVNRRAMLGVRTVTPSDDEAIVCHQNHDDERAGLTPRVEFGPDGWRAEIDALGMTAEKCKYPAVDNLW